jgi:phosphatidylglycerol:prolipoprotein diacylglycerol transferase
MFLIILFVRKRFHPYDGFLVPVYFILYGILRFVVEFFRGDHNPTHVFGLSDQQMFSLLSIAIGIGFYFVLSRRPGARAVAK